MKCGDEIFFSLEIGNPFVVDVVVIVVGIVIGVVAVGGDIHYVVILQREGQSKAATSLVLVGCQAIKNPPCFVACFAFVFAHACLIINMKTIH